MSETKITDLVPQETIDKVKELNTEMQSLLTSYTTTAKELSKGLDVNVKVIGDVDKLEKLFVEKSKEAAEQTTRLNAVIKEQGQVIANTTNTISRQLMEQERVNKTTRDVYTEYDRVKKLLEEFNGSYDDHIKRLMSLNSQLAANSKQQKDNEKALKSGRMSLADYHNAQADLIAQHRMLTQEKRTLQQIMTAEEKAMQSADTSYVQMSQQLELLKKAYKDLSVEAREGDIGREMEEAIQNLDAHLKDVAADMGEFQRNVGNYAIAGQNGVVSTESLMAALNQQAVTTKDVSDQSKILLEARSMLDTSDENYAQTVALINDKLAENSRRLSDVSDIMNVEAKSVAEAEAQNKRLTEALKQVDQSSADADKTIAALNAKIAENNKVIEAGTGGKASIKKDLKELVLEIANLTIEYQKLSEQERNSAEGKVLAQHIQELTEQAGALKDAISDTNQAISNAASDTRGLDRLTGALDLAINGFGLATGAAEILGISEGELTEIQTKLMAAIAASNAMSKIQNTLQKQSAITQGTLLVQTKLRAVAENLHTVAQGKGIIVTKAATVAQWAFNAAAAANPVGLIVIAIVACIAAVYGLIKAFEAFTSADEKASKQCEAMVESTNRLIEANEALIASMERRGDSYAKVHAQIIQNLQEEYAEMVKTMNYAETHDVSAEAYEKAFTQFNEGFKRMGDAYFAGQDFFSKMIQEAHDAALKSELGAFEARRQIVEREFKEYEAYANKILEIGQQLGYVSADLLDWDALKKEKERRLKEIDDEEKKANQAKYKQQKQNADKAAEELRKAVEAGEDALLKLIANSGERELATEKLKYERKKKQLEKQLSALGAKEIEMRDAINNQLRGLDSEHEQKMALIKISNQERILKTEESMLKLHLEAVGNNYEEQKAIRLQQLTNQEAAERLAIEKGLAENNYTVEQAEQMRNDITRKYGIMRTNLESEFAQKKSEQMQQKYASERIIQDRANSDEINALNARYVREMDLARGNSEKREEIIRKYEEDRTRIEEQYAQQTIRDTIQMLEDILKVENLSADERLRIEQELAKAKIELNNQVSQAQKNSIDRQISEEERLRQQRYEKTQQWVQYAQEAVNQIGELISNLYSGQLNELEELQDANTEAGEKEQERIERLVEQNVITEEEGEARKRAAEEKTARKNEELERKKAEIKRRQAVFDKALSIANIGLNTAMALMQLWVKPGWPAAIPMMAVVGALGALQLAVALATPIPKYAMGTQNHPGGPAIVGDGGRPEIVTFGNNAWLTPDIPTLVNLPAGSSVFPSIMDYDDAFPGLVKTLSDGKTPPQIVVNNDYQKLEQKMDKVIYLFSVLNRSRKDEQTSAYIEILKAQKGL